MTGWTEEREALLSKLWIDGVSAGRIAKQLGSGATKSSVIGKARRLKLPPHSTYMKNVNRRLAGDERRAPIRPAGRAEPKRGQAPDERAPRQAKPQAPKLRLVAPAVPAEGGPAAVGRPFTSRPFGGCAFPVAGEGADTLSCCAPVRGEASYCAAHCAVMYRPGKKKRKKENVDRLFVPVRRRWAA